MKKTLLLIYSIVFLNFANADEYMQYEDDYDYGCCCNSQCDWGDFYVGGDWLYWRVQEERLQVGALVDITGSTDENLQISSKVLEPKFKHSNGYRVFAGYLFPCSDWRIEGTFTHIPSHASFNHVGGPINITMDFVSIFNANFPILNAIANNMFESVGARWKADVNYFDFDVSRKICLWEIFQFVPHLGIRGQWIKQTYDIDGFTTTQSGPFSFETELDARLKAIGVEAGLWGAWNVGCGFSILGHFGGSIAYAKLHNQGVLDATDGTTAHISYNDHSTLTLTTFDSFLGAAYSTCLWGSVINVHAGWEHHIILDTNQFSIVGGGNMILQGLTLGAGISF